jgi:hypothetical protein
MLTFGFLSLLSFYGILSYFGKKGLSKYRPQWKYHLLTNLVLFPVSVPVLDRAKVTARLEAGSEMTIKLEQLPCPSSSRNARNIGKN